MKRSLKKLIAIFMLFLHIVSLADGIVPDNAASRNLQIDKAANGVPLVNIEAPDNNGTSHNVYKDYNVDGRGAILNNAKDLTNSQLGGLIYGNPNLQNSNEASTIINEVSGVNRSRIEGYQEIAGKRANYILANPNGIYINGAGFINTGNVTFTTGRGNNLLNPEKGMIEVAGKGLDLRNINKAELIARVAELSAPIYGGEEVNLKLGSQGKSNKPEYALDARALGSIYAGRINIIVNEDGVGVKTQAPMYATKGDVVISSKGKVYLKDTQAKGDIKISSTETEIDNKLLAENKINIENKKLLNKGQIIANKDVTIKGNVKNNKLIFTNNNLYIEGNLKNTANIQTKNNIEINGKNTENTGFIVADKKININSDNINNTNKLVAKDTLDINNKILTNSGKIYSGNETKIVNQKINNLGDITSSGEIDINSTDIENNNILANGDISINTKELKSKGKIYSDKNVSLISNNIENNELTAKNLKIVTDKLNNNAKIVTTANIDITAKNLVNKGMICSTGKNDLKVTDLRNSGNILSVGNINISQNKNLINSRKIQSNNDITINSENIENNELIGNNINITTNSLKNNNKIVAKADNSITAKDLVNIGHLYSTGKNDLKVTNLRNSGNILSVGNINISQNKNLINNRKIQSNNDITINSENIENNELIAKNINIETGKLENSDKLIATNNMVVNSGILKNSSLVQALKMTLIGDTITNNGNVLGVNDITIKNKNLKNDGSLVNNGRIQAKNILELNIKDIENNNIIFSKDSNINSQSLKNKNEIVSTGKAVINSDSLENDNTKGVIFSKDELNLISNKINLTRNIGAGKLLKLTTNKLERPDSYITDSDLDITINGDYTNNKELIGKNLKLTANNLENNSIMASAGKTELKGNNSFKNNANSLLYGRELVKLEGRNFINKGEVSSFGDLNMNFTGDITNLKTIEAAGNGEITANNYINKGYLTGNHSYKEVSGAESNIDVSKLPPEIKQRVEEQLQEEWNKSSRHHKEWDGESYLDGAKIGVSNYKSNKAYLKTEGNLTFNITNKLLNQEADILAGKNITINAGELNNTREGKEVDIELYFKRDYTYKKRHRIDGSRSSADFSTEIPYKQTLFSDKPTQIIAGGNITINAEKVGNGEYQIHKSGYTNDIKKLEKASNIKDIDINKNIDTETTSNVGSNLKAKDISLTSLGNIGIIGSNVVADNKMNIGAKGDIAIVAGKDSTLHEEKHSKSKGFGRSESSTDIAYATHNVASNVIGDKVNIASEKNISLLGSNVQANAEGQIKADGNITQAGVKDTNYSYHKKTKTGFMGLTSKSVTDENYAEKAILSATLAGNDGLTYDSKNNLILSGVKVVSSGNINLKGKDVEINPLETKSYNKHEEVKKGFSGSFSPKGISVSYGKDKLESKTDILNQTASQIVSNKDINIEATDKVKAKSVDIYAKNDINISGDNGVEISTANNSYDNTTKQSSSRIGASVGINSAIVNTVENVRDIKKLTDFSGNSYDILNNASKVVGAIKDGAAATNDLINYKYSGTDSTGAETLKNDPNIFKTSISFNKSKSKSTVHNETVEKSSLVSGRNMNIKSKNGSISISGTDVKVGNDLDLSAKKDITIKASEENFTSSNSSSQMGIGLSADLSKGKIADLSISKAGTKGRGNGTNYINSTVNVGGKLKTDSENLTLSGANVEADKLDIKAKNLVIESKQDKSERKDSSYGGSFSIDLANPSSFSANINGSKGSGEKEWVNKQTSLIARNGGKVDTENLTNIGAVIGSENEKEKLKVSANKVIVKDLEDKNKYENIGGGITIGTDVPNTSIKHDKVDKEQIDRATAINTDFEISGKSTSGEDLGFNTDIDKSQEKTKDEEKHLDAELHTDLIGEDKRNEIKYAFKKLGSLHEILDQKKFKESMEGVLVDKFKDEHQKEFNLIKDKNLSLEDKQKLAQNLVERYLRENGYQGIIPEVLLTDEAHSFTVDSKDKETGAKRREKIYFSINDMANPDLAFSQLFGHEKAHMNTYDEGKDGEETSIHTREKIGNENKNKVFTEGEKTDYLNNLRNKYKNQKSIEQQFAEAKLVPEKDKEHWYDEKTHNEYKYKVTFTKDETKYLTKKYKISEKELKEDPTKYVYFESLDKNNRVFKDKKEFEKFQDELKEKIKNEKDPKKREELEKQIYKKLPNTESQYHNIKIDENGNPYIDTTFPNEKYANNIGQEAVFDKKSGKWIKDGINDATYNIAYWEKDLKLSDLYDHLFDEKGDVELWEDYGVGPHDKLTKDQRKEISELGKSYLLNLSYRRYANKNKKSSLDNYIKYKEEIIKKWE